MSALFKESTYYANAEVIEDAVVCRIYRDDVKSILKQNPEMAYRFLAALSERLRDADEWAGSISLLDAERRLAKTLIFYQGKVQPSEAFKLPVSKKDLAGLLGVTAETLSRKLAAPEARNIISLKGKTGIEIVDVTSLKEIALKFPVTDATGDTGRD